MKHVNEKRTIERNNVTIHNCYLVEFDFIYDYKTLKEYEYDCAGWYSFQF